MRITALRRATLRFVALRSQNSNAALVFSLCLKSFQRLRTHPTSEKERDLFTSAVAIDI
jgi:hypothetical protein